MDQKDWNKKQKNLVNDAYIDLLRKRISQEGYERIRDRTYHDYLDGLGMDASQWRDHRRQVKEGKQVRY